MQTMHGARLPVQITGAIEMRVLYKDRDANVGCEFFGEPDTKCKHVSLYAFGSCLFFLAAATLLEKRAAATLLEKRGIGVHQNGRT